MRSITSRIKVLILFSLIFSTQALAQEVPAISAMQMDRGIPLGNELDIYNRRALHTIIGNLTPIPVDASGSTIPITGSVSVTNFPAIQPVSQSGTWTTGRTWSLLNTTDSVNVGNFPATQAVTQSGTWTVQQGTPPWSVSQSGAWTTGRTWTLGFSTDSITSRTQDGSGNAITSQISGSQRALDTGIVVAGVQIDPRAIRALNSTDVVTAVQPTGSNLHVNVDSAPTTSVTQGTSPWIVSGTVAATQSGAWSTGRTWTLLNSTDSVNAVQSGTWTVQQGTPPWSVSQSGSWTTGRTWTLGSGTDSITAIQGTSPWVISGTVTANIGTTNGLALDATVSALQISQGSTTSGQKGTLTLGAVTSALPTYSTAQSSPFSLTTTGLLRVDNSNVTQPVSGSLGRTWALSSGTDSVSSVQSGTWTTGRTWTLASGTDSIAALQSGTWTVQQGGTPTAVTNAWPFKLTDGTNTVAVKAASTAALATDPSAVVALSPNSPLPTGTNNIGSITSVTGTVSLPTGASTSALQTTGNTTLFTISSTQTSGGQKSQTVDGAGAVAGPELAYQGVNYFPVYTPLDTITSTVNVTTQDLASSTTTGYANQSMVTGTPTAGSAAAFSVSSIQTVMVIITGTWTGTLSIEVSSDGGVIFEPRSIHVVGTPTFSSLITANVVGSLNASAKTNVRVRATTAVTGTASIKMLFSDNPSNMYVANAIKIVDASSTTSTNQLTIKAASTPAVATDTAAVVAISPGTPITTKTGLTPNAPFTVSVGVASGVYLASNAIRKGLCAVNTSNATVSFGLGAAAVLNSGITLYPGGTWCMDEYTFTTGAINAIAGSAASGVAGQEFQ